MSALDQVFARLRVADVPHANEIVSGLADGSITVDRSSLAGAGCSCAELHDTYTFRSRPRQAPSEHSTRLRHDTLRLVDGLARHKEKRCYTLGFSKEPNISYALFVLSDFAEVLGCYMSYDRRKTSDEEWERIWGEEAGPTSPSSQPR